MVLVWGHQMGLYSGLRRLGVVGICRGVEWVHHPGSRVARFPLGVPLPGAPSEVVQGGFARGQGLGQLVVPVVLLLGPPSEVKAGVLLC